jgi:hypothetical protein
MKFVLNNTDVLEFCELLFKSKQVRDLVLLKIQEADENNEYVEEENDNEIPIILKTETIKVKKARGRPKKSTSITIQDVDETDLNLNI